MNMANVRVHYTDLQGVSGFRYFNHWRDALEFVVIFGPILRHRKVLQKFDDFYRRVL